ncbi:MAG TPA: hypothetical protein VLZ84_03375 [Asticcacaulis sp.]|nr:hypothetical protein [Asticcacaulis sp.]
MTAYSRLTPYCLAVFFAVILVTLIAATAWSHEQASHEAATNAAEAAYVPADENMPVTDAVPFTDPMTDKVAA